MTWKGNRLMAEWLWVAPVYWFWALVWPAWPW
jgi:hypothetical protein